MTEFTEPLATMFEKASPHRYLRIAPQEVVRVVAIYVDGMERPVEPATLTPGREAHFLLPAGTRADANVGVYVELIDRPGRRPMGGEMQPPLVAAVTHIDPKETVTSTLNPCSRSSAPPAARLQRFDLQAKGPVDDLVITSIRIGCEEQLVTGFGVPAAMLLTQSFAAFALPTICAGALLTVTWKNLGRKKERITLSGGLVFESVETDATSTPSTPSTPFSYPPGYGVHPRPSFGGRH